MSAMFPAIIVSAVVFLLVFTCMWRTEKDEQEDLAEDEAEEKVKQEEDIAVKKSPLSRRTTDLDHAKSAHHHDHMARRAAEISRSTNSVKRAQGMATKQQVMSRAGAALKTHRPAATAAAAVPLLLLLPPPRVLVCRSSQ